MGLPFTLFTDCRNFQWIETYDGDNAADVRRLHLGIIGLIFTVNYHIRHLNEDSNGLSQLSVDTLLGFNITGIYSDNKTLNQYYQVVHQFSIASPSPSGNITPHKFPGFLRKRTIDCLGPAPVPLTPVNMAFIRTAIDVINAPVYTIKPMSLFNNDIECTAHSASTFSWIVH